MRGFEIRIYDEGLPRTLDEDLACRAGLAVAGKLVQVSGEAQSWDTALAPLGDARQRAIEIAG